MQRKLISSGSSFEAEIGYSRAVSQGDWVFVSGTTGFDYATMTIAEDIESQTEQCLKNIESALAQAGASLNDIVRINYVVVPEIFISSGGRPQRVPPATSSGDTAVE